MKTVKTAYGQGLAAEYDGRRFSSSGGKRIHDVEVAILDQALSRVEKKASRVLEVGCGTGRLLEEVVGRGVVATGLDPSSHMLSETRKKLPDSESVSLVEGESGALPFDTSSFDFVYAIRVLNQTESRGYASRTIAEMLRVTDLGGYTLVEFMNLRRSHLSRKRVRLGDRELERVNAADVRLLVSEVRDTVAESAEVIWAKGAFFFGMTAYYKVPNVLLGVLQLVDGVVSRLLPGWCSRCYVLLKKK